ncbi:MAG: MFS transporter [Spirochaetales bacterium]
MAEKADGFKKYLPLTFLIGAGFFTMGLMDPLYDSYVTIFLSRYIPYKWIVGMFMALDNVLAIFLIPLISARSDATKTKIGRRMPWIIVLLPLSALFFSLIPYAAQYSLMMLVIVLAFLNIFKQSARGPVVALMPDVVPPEYRSQGNGVINTMGNIAGLVGTLFLAQLMDVDTVLPILGATKNVLAFPVAGILVVLATIMLLLFVKENKNKLYTEESQEEKIPFLKSMKAVLGGNTQENPGKSDKSAFFVLLSLFLWFMAYQGMLPYVAEYSILTFNLSMGNGALAAGMVAIASAIFAIPMGYAAGKWGRKRMIRISLIAVAVILTAQYILALMPEVAGESSVYIFWALMFLFGIFWICIVANSFPMLWQMAGFTHIGLYTGLYYTFSQAAAILAPFIGGLIIDFVGHKGVFIYGALFFVAACITMGRVKHGEKND